MITFLREYCDMSFRDACEEIGVDPSELGDYTSVSLHPAQVYGPPNKTWQERGEQMVAKAQAVLRSRLGKDALEYLRTRGLKDETILDKQLGYIPLGPDGRWYSTSLEEWGLTADATGKDKLWQPEGILIPWYVNGKLWKIDVRRLTGLKKA
jgi:DNA primase